MKRILARAMLAAVSSLAAMPLAAQDVDQRIAANIQDWVRTYRYLHQHPELSTQEKETSAFVAAALKRLGYDVTDHVGRYEEPGQVCYGVVAVMKNGPGPTVYVRTELDALPVTEKTGLAYASKVTVKRAGGEVGVMHACGHDLHMTVFLATAKMLAKMKTQWSGTVVMIGQPAEEVVGGAKAMLRDGLFTRFPKPDFVLALHDHSMLPVGKVAWKEGPMLAGADTVDITVRGYGGHGAAPTTKDPIVIASEIVVMLQTIVSREMDPLQPTVVTVGSFHAGTKHNIIPDDAHLQITVRTMTPKQRTKVLEAVARIANGVASAAGVPAERMPVIEFGNDHVPATINDSSLAKRVGAALDKALGKENVLAAGPIMGAEDFSLYGLADPKPATMMFWLGAVQPEKFRDAKEKGTRLPSLHSSEFAPDAEPAIRTGVKAMTAAIQALLPKP